MKEYAFKVSETAKIRKKGMFLIILSRNTGLGLGKRIKKVLIILNKLIKTVWKFILEGVFLSRTKCLFSVFFLGCVNV